MLNKYENQRTESRNVVIDRKFKKKITKTKTKRIIGESSRKNITKTKTIRIISESSRKNITKNKNKTNYQ